MNRDGKWSTPYKAGVVTGVGFGVIFGFAIATGANPNPIDWLAALPVCLFGIGAFLVGRAIADRDERQASGSDRAEESIE